MDNKAGYHILKTIAKFHYKISFLYIDWPVQSPDLNPIKNLWRIIKLRISIKKYKIQLLEQKKIVIEEKQNKLIIENFCKYIESTRKYYKLVILAKGDAIKYQSINFVE